MQTRYDNNIDPNHKYTLDEIEAMQNDPNFIDHSILSRYSPEFCLYLFNDVAYDGNYEQNNLLQDNRFNNQSYPDMEIPQNTSVAMSRHGGFLKRR